MQLDTLCLTGRVMWGRLSKAGLTTGGRPIRSTPIALFQRPNAAHWLAVSESPEESEQQSLSSYGQAVLDQLRQRGASFFHDLVQAAGLLPTQVEQALGELAAVGLVTSDSFAGSGPCWCRPRCASRSAAARGGTGWRRSGWRARAVVVAAGTAAALSP
jgi:ATP-dependent Lhr-like helicase